MNELIRVAADVQHFCESRHWAARRWRRREGLSLADRLCLALAERLDTPVLTADAAWEPAGRIRQIR